MLSFPMTSFLHLKKKKKKGQMQTFAISYLHWVILNKVESDLM